MSDTNIFASPGTLARYPFLKDAVLNGMGPGRGIAFLSNEDIPAGKVTPDDIVKSVGNVVQDPEVSHRMMGDLARTLATEKRRNGAEIPITAADEISNRVNSSHLDPTLGAAAMPLYNGGDAVVILGDNNVSGKDYISGLSGLSAKDTPDAKEGFKNTILAHEIGHTGEKERILSAGDDAGQTLLSEVRADCGIRGVFNTEALPSEALAQLVQARQVGSVLNTQDPEHATGAFLEQDGSCPVTPTISESNKALEGLSSLQGKINERLGQMYAGDALKAYGQYDGRLFGLGQLEGNEVLNGFIYNQEALTKNLPDALATQDPKVMKSLGEGLRYGIGGDAIDPAAVYSATRQLKLEGGLEGYEATYADKFLESAKELSPDLVKRADTFDREKVPLDWATAQDLKVEAEQARAKTEVLVDRMLASEAAPTQADRPALDTAPLIEPEQRVAMAAPALAPAPVMAP